MNTRKIQHSLEQISRHIPMARPAACWYLSDKVSASCIQPESRKWSCVFGYFRHLAEGGRICFSAEKTGCSGAACYFGYKTPSKNAGRFLAEREKFKKSAVQGNAFYDQIDAPDTGSRFLIWETAATIDDSISVEVINLWINADALPDLVTLANFDRSSNDSVVIPFASGCQSIWTLPYKEKDTEEPKCVVGCMDPAMRKYLPGGLLSFSMPANRLIEMTDHISDSFLTISHKNT